MRYRSKPTEIEAVQWRGDNLASLDVMEIPFSYGDGGLFIAAGEGEGQQWCFVPVGYWIARYAGDHSDHWPIRPEAFAAKYEEIT